MANSDSNRTSKTMAATNIFVLATVCIAFSIGLIHASILRNPPVYLGPGSVPQPINIEVQTDKRVVYTYGDKTQGTCNLWSKQTYSLNFGYSQRLEIHWVIWTILLQIGGFLIATASNFEIFDTPRTIQATNGYPNGVFNLGVTNNTLTYAQITVEAVWRKSHFGNVE